MMLLDFSLQSDRRVRCTVKQANWLKTGMMKLLRLSVPSLQSIEVLTA